MRALRVALVLGGVALALFVGCTVNPVTGKSQLDLMGESQEVSVGEQLYPRYTQVSLGEVADSELELGMEDVKKQNNITSEQFEGLLAQEGYTLASYKAFMRKHLARLKLVNLKGQSHTYTWGDKAPRLRSGPEAKDYLEPHSLFTNITDDDGNTYLCITGACTEDDRRRITEGFGSFGGKGG